MEDLHTAYWPPHGGGLRRPESFIETAKNLVDQMHVDYIGKDTIRTPIGDRTTSVHFYDSVVVFEVGEARKQGNKTTGQSERFDTRWAPDGVDADAFSKISDEIVENIEKSNPLWEDFVPDDRDACIRHLGAEISLLRTSPSGKLTRLVRAVGRLLGLGKDG